jgi:hypothetical protein
VTIATDNDLAGVNTAGLIKLTNSNGGATNVNKTIIIDATGNLQIADSTLSQFIFNLTDSGNLAVSGNITADYFLGNGSALTGIAVTNIANGSSSVAIPLSSGNVVTTVQGEEWVFDVLSQILAPNFNGSGPARIRFQTDSVAIGNAAGETNQGDSAVAIGYLAGNDTQGSSAVAVGTNAGAIAQGTGATALGVDAGTANQGLGAVAVGSNAGNDNQGNAAVAIGQNSGLTIQGIQAVAVGAGAGLNNQSSQAVAVGVDSGSDLQGQYSVAVGPNAGQYTQGTSAVAIGSGAGTNTQGELAVAIGALAGSQNQGINAIAIGGFAGENDQPANSIIINASGGTLEGTESGLYIDPVRNDTGNVTNAVYYNTATKEVTYGSVAVPPAEASFTVETGNFAAAAGSRYGVNASGGNVTATLPAAPDTGAAIFFADAGGYSASNLLNINSGLNTIMGVAMY